MNILDDSTILSTIDEHCMRNVLEKTPQLYLDALKLGEAAEIALRKPERILFIGMGGSAVGCSLIKDWSYDRASTPIEVCRDSLLPKYADKQTLILAVSYSGNTQETLSNLTHAVERGCPALGVSSGGFLKRLCLKHQLPHVEVPPGFQPRAALPYLLGVPAAILDRLGVAGGLIKEARGAVKTLRNLGESLKPSNPTTQNPAKNLAIKLKGTLPVVYGFREYATVAYRLKTQLNENSKTFCKWEVLPELDHNEVVGWEGVKPQLGKLLSVIFIQGDEEHHDLKARLEVTRQIIAGKTKNIYEINGEGPSRLARMLSTVYLGDYISFYLAVLNRIDPTPVGVIDYLKMELEKKTGFQAWIEKKLG